MPTNNTPLVCSRSFEAYRCKQGQMAKSFLIIRLHFMVSEAATVLINTQTEMSAVRSDGEMIGERDLWTSQSPQIYSQTTSWCGRDPVTMGMRHSALSAQWLSGTRDCLMEGWTGRQQDKTCPPKASEAEFATYDVIWYAVCVIVCLCAWQFCLVCLWQHVLKTDVPQCVSQSSMQLFLNFFNFSNFLNIIVCPWACGVFWNSFFSDVGTFSGVYLLLCEMAAVTFSGNNRDIKAKIMKEIRRNQRTVKLNAPKTTLSNHGED